MYEKFILKKLDTYYKIFLGILILLLCSCVKDDDTSFSEKNVLEDDIPESLGMISALNYFEANNSEADCCFTFVYPITMICNTGIKMKVYNYEGLSEVIGAQNDNFNIVGVDFPVKVTLQTSNTVFLIEDEKELINLLNLCGIPSLRSEFNTLYNQCFKIEYPAVLYDKNKQKVYINNDAELDSLFYDQGIYYQPDFKFPQSLSIAPDSTSVTVSSYYGFYKIINNCVRCPEVSFDIEEIPLLGDGNFIITPKFVIEEDYVVSFIIENNSSLSGVFQTAPPYNIQLLFEPDIYEICFDVVTPSCPEGVRECQEIEVPAICPVINFTYINDDPFDGGVHLFTPVVTGRLEGEELIDWYLDGSLVEIGAQSNNVSIELNTGSNNTVCAKIVTKLCPVGIEYCTDIYLP